MNSYASLLFGNNTHHAQRVQLQRICSQTWPAGEIRSSDITTHNNYYKGHYEYNKTINLVMGKSLEPLQ